MERVPTFLARDATAPRGAERSQSCYICTVAAGRKVLPRPTGHSLQRCALAADFMLFLSTIALLLSILLRRQQRTVSRCSRGLRKARQEAASRSIVLESLCVATPLAAT